MHNYNFDNDFNPNNYKLKGSHLDILTNWTT